MDSVVSEFSTGLSDDKDRLGEQRNKPRSGLPWKCQNIKKQNWQDTHNHTGNPPSYSHTHTRIHFPLSFQFSIYIACIQLSSVYPSL